MSLGLFRFAGLLLLFPACSPAQHAHFVDPFLGSAGGGNVFPGATLPFGMLKAGPDTGDNNANSGWTPDQPFNGFSQTHVSGTGGGAKYGNILVQPTTGMILPQDHGSPRSHEHASPGFYGVTLNRYNIGVEIASARRSAIYRFTYPAGATANLLLDVGHCLISSAKYGEGQAVTSSSVDVVSSTEIVGFSSVTGGWNKQPNAYTVYFYGLTDTPTRISGAWRDGVLHPETRGEAGIEGSKIGIWLTFPARSKVVRMKIGISFVSVEQAKQMPSLRFPASTWIVRARRRRKPGTKR